MFGNTLVIPPSVAANTARKPYLNVRMEKRENKRLRLSSTAHKSKDTADTHVFKSLFFHTFSTNCLMMPVSRIRLWSSKLSPKYRI